MGEAKRFGPESLHGGPTDETGGVLGRAADGRREDRLGPRRHRREPVAPERGETPPRRSREPAAQRRGDPRKVRRPTRDGDDRHPHGSGDRPEVEDVEPSDHGPVEQDRPDPVPRAEGPEQGQDASRSVRPVDPHRPDANGLQAVGQRDDHRRHGSRSVPSGERPVVDRGDPGMALPEGAPQR